MPAVLALPYIVPFAEAAGIAIGTIASAVGLMELSKRVQAYMDANPEESLKILTLLAPAQGIAAMFNKKAGEGEEEVEVEEDLTKLSGKEKGKRMKEEAQKKKGNYSDTEATGNYESKQGRMIRMAEKLGLADPKLKDKPYDKSKKYQGYKRFLKAKGGVVRGLDAGTHKNVRLI